MAFKLGCVSPGMEMTVRKRVGESKGGFKVVGVGSAAGSCVFPSFLPKEVENIKDPFARDLAQRIQRLPVKDESGGDCIMSSCVQPRIHSEETSPVVLLHSFDSSCLEWRLAYPLLEEAGLEAWAIDVLGWGFSDLERRPPCGATSKTDHLYQLWKSHIRRPMVLVGPSLGAAVAIDFTVNYPEAVEKLVLINPNVYAEGTRDLAKLPKILAYAGVLLLQTFPLRFYANVLAFNNLPLSEGIDWTKVSRLHCLLPWWKDATVNFIVSGGYNVISKIKQVQQKTLIIFGENDKLVSKKLVVRLYLEMLKPNLRVVPDAGHLPHVEKPQHVAKLIADFALGNKF